jgi:ribonuclease P protein component
MLRLKKRAEFLAVSRGTRAGRRAFSLQCGTGATTSETVPRVGFTVTKKVGTATERNRIRRRLRAAVADLPADAAKPGRDYVIVGRREALAEPYATLVSDLAQAMRQLGRRPVDRPADRSAPRSGARAAADPEPGASDNPLGTR